MQALAEGQLEADQGLAKHLEQCLGCRNCEPVCPANVPYGKLIDAAHRLLREEGHNHGAWQSFIQNWLASPRWLALSAKLGRFYHQSGLRRLAEASVLRLAPKLRRLSELLPYGKAGISQRQIHAIPLSEQAPPIQLFMGCISQHFSPGVANGAEYLLRAAGFAVLKPKGQGCCAAPAQHAGDISQARPLLKNNLVAFDPQLPIVGMASGCTATLMEYGQMVDEADYKRFSSQVQDICAVLEPLRDRFRLRSLPEDVVLHLPCSQRNVVSGSEAIVRLLQGIPDIRLHRLVDKGQCCGAAGTYLLTQADMADELGQSLAQEIAAQEPALVVTSNIGCRLQLSRQLRRLDCHAPVMHPVELLAQQLEL